MHSKGNIFEQPILLNQVILLEYGYVIHFHNFA
jgi:hypothetical protein